MMRRFLLFVVFTACFCDLYAQKKDLAETDALIVKPVYDEKFDPVPGDPEVWLAARLNILDLDKMVETGVIHRDDMMGLALPLGVHNRKGKVDLPQGLLDMWYAKAEWMAGRRDKIDADILKRALEFIMQSKDATTEKTNLLAYRTAILSPAMDKVQAIHEAKKEAFSEERRVFLDIIVDNFSANMLLGYNIQELVPPTHMVGKDIFTINPLFKAYYLDLLLQKGGTVFLEAFPARYDALLSHGPFQMTELALEGMTANKRLFTEMKAYPKMQDLKNISDHALVAAFFAYHNWEMLSFTLNEAKLLGVFNEYFKNHKKDKEKQRQLRVLIAGMTACMHHNPAKSRRMFSETLQNNADLGKMYHEILSKADKQMHKYYRSAAEAYLIMKVYDQLIK